MEKRYLNVDECAVYLNVSKHTVYGWISKGKLPHYKIGGKLVRFDLLALERWMERKKIPEIR